jgi:hypothetical protein
MANPLLGRLVSAILGVEPMNIKNHATWINDSADYPQTPTFRTAGILLLGALLWTPYRLRRKFFPPKPTISAAGGFYDLSHMGDVLKPVYTPIRNMIPRAPAYGAAIVFRAGVEDIPEEDTNEQL